MAANAEPTGASATSAAIRSFLVWVVVFALMMFSVSLMPSPVGRYGIGWLSRPLSSLSCLRKPSDVAE
jgi:hypothetical protein